MVGIMASRSTRIITGKEEVNGLMKPKEWSSKPMETIRGKWEVNELVNSLDWLKSQ